MGLPSAQRTMALKACVLFSLGALQTQIGTRLERGTRKLVQVNRFVVTEDVQRNNAVADVLVHRGLVFRILEDMTTFAIHR